MSFDALAASGLGRTGPLGLVTLPEARSRILDTPLRTQLPTPGPFRIDGPGAFDALVYTAPLMGVFATRGDGAKGSRLDVQA